jgi:hypothetical protein
VLQKGVVNLALELARGPTPGSSGPTTFEPPEAPSLVETLSGVLTPISGSLIRRIFALLFVLAMMGFACRHRTNG